MRGSGKNARDHAVVAGGGIAGLCAARVLSHCYPNTARTTYPVWMMNAIGDISFHHADAGRIPWWWRPSGALFDQFLGAAETEPALAEWFLRRFSLLDSLYMIPPPGIMGRAIAHNMRLWLGERRERRQAAKDRRRAVTTLRSP